MRNKDQKGDLSVQAIAGTHSVDTSHFATGLRNIREPTKYKSDIWTKPIEWWKRYWRQL